MGVMYLFDSMQKVRAVVKDGLTEWIHHEHTYTLDAAMLSRYKPLPGEYLGFECVDGLWRLFCIDSAEVDDEQGLTYIKATDAAVDDLSSIITIDAYQEDVTARAAVGKLISGTEWALGAVATGDETNTTDAQYVPLWEALETVAEVFGVRVVPYYKIENGEIKAKRIDLLADTAAYRGRFFESRTDASSVVVTYKQRPYTVMYGLGKANGTEGADRLTIADVVWSKVNGDPADKPAGQTWVEDPAAVAKYGRRERVMISDKVEDPAELMRLTWEALQEENKPKVSVDAIIRDMEQIKGQKWKAVRLGDKIIVRTAQGEDVNTRITGIDRDYIHPDETKLTAGEDLPSAIKQVASLARAAIHTRETLTIYQNKFLHDEALIQLNADTILANAIDIMINAENIDIQAKEIISLRAGVDDNTASIVLANGRIDAQAANMITLQAGVNENAASIALANGRIDLQAETIRQKADLILLEGYVKMTDFEAVNADISNILSGLTTATVLRAVLVDASNGSFDALDAAILNHNGALVSQRTISMGEVASVGKALSTGGELNLQHSHKVSVGSDGTVTLGEVATQGGNFKIADTKVYKDGVSAAYGNGYNEGFDSGKETYRPTAINRTGYDVSKKTVTVRALNSHQDLLTNVAINASEIYDAGYLHGKALYLWKSDSNPAEKTIYASTSNDVEVLLTDVPLDATDVYDVGYNNGWNACRNAQTAIDCLIISSRVIGELYYKNGQSAGEGFYRGTEATLYSKPAARE